MSDLKFVVLIAQVVLRPNEALFISKSMRERSDLKCLVMLD